MNEEYEIRYKDAEIEKLLHTQEEKQVPRKIKIVTKVPDYDNINPNPSDTVEDIAELYAGRYIARPESSAEHTYSTIMLSRYFCPAHVDKYRVLLLLLYHDYPEIIAGDVPLQNKEERIKQKEKEEKAYKQLCIEEPYPINEEVKKYWDEFQHGTSIEANYARAIDRIDGLLARVKNKHHFDDDVNINEIWLLWAKDLRAVPELLEFGWHLFNYAERKGLFK